jgi:hypothetical protein
MSNRTIRLLLCLVIAASSACESGTGDGGRAKVRSRSSPGCQVLSASPFPAGLDWLPGTAGRAVAATFEPGAVFVLDAAGDAPVFAADVPILAIPDDSDGDGVPEGSGAVPEFPLVDDVVVVPPALVDAGLGLVTASGYEEVILFHPDRGELATLEVGVGIDFAPGDYPRLPPPGASALRTAISTEACVRPVAPIDSFGENYAEGFPPSVVCDPAVPGSFYGRFTSGATVAGGRLFVSLSNLGQGANTGRPQFLPGAVLVYDLDLASLPPFAEPSPEAEMIETEGFNPTQVTRAEVGGREFVLVTISGAIGIGSDDPGTPEVEQGTVALTDGAIEVLDPDTLEHLGAIPLGLGAPTFDRLAIHPSGRVAVTGSALARELYVVDLAGLGRDPIDLADAVVYDADSALGFPALPGGPSLERCAPLVGGIAWNASGDRLYATERCDGSLTEFAFSLRETPAGSVDPASFRWLATTELVQPLRPETLGELRDPGRLRVRAGRPGVDYSGPDLLFLGGQPDGQVCAQRLESF